jgi:hypothetical protein
VDFRVRKLNGASPRARAKFVLYWMQMNRRAESNLAIEHEPANSQLTLIFPS